MVSPTTRSAGAVTHFDARPFFEKALRYGLDHGLLGQAKLDAMLEEAPKGMVQIARYFGSEFLRPELEKARERLVNLVSLQLEHSTQGDVHDAALQLRDNTLLSRSKAGSDLLKALIVMPQSSSVSSSCGESNENIKKNKDALDDWISKTYEDYRREYESRLAHSKLIEAAFWFARRYGMSTDKLIKDAPQMTAEAVIRTALLLGLTRQKKFPDWPSFENLVEKLRQRSLSVDRLKLPKEMPQHYRGVVETVLESVTDDWPRLMNLRLPKRKFFFYLDEEDQIEKPIERYFWIEDFISEISHHDRQCSKEWQKLTDGKSDEGTVLTLCLCVAAGRAPKRMLSEDSAKRLIRYIRKNGLKPSLAKDYLEAQAPVPYRQAFLVLWNDFMTEAQDTLLSDHDYTINDALALLRRECNVA